MEGYLGGYGGDLCWRQYIGLKSPISGVEGIPEEILIYFPGEGAKFLYSFRFQMVRLKSSRMSSKRTLSGNRFTQFLAF